jgi:hypothetical protein
MASETNGFTYTPVQLNLKPKGDKFLYYKRKFERVENSIRVFPFWNNAFVWVYISFSIITFYYIFFLINKSIQNLPSSISILLFQTNQTVFGKEYLYVFLFVPLIFFIATFVIAYSIYATRKFLAYILITTNFVSTTLFLIALIKIIQMHYSLI